MGLKNTRDMLSLRWRCAQALLAITDRNHRQVEAIRAAMRIEGMADGDIFDELMLLRDQFGLRPRGKLLDEIHRLGLKLGIRP